MTSKYQLELEHAELTERVSDLEAALNDVSAVEINGAHIVITWIEHGDVSVGFDAAGNAVRVEFAPILGGWVAE